MINVILSIQLRKSIAHRFLYLMSIPTTQILIITLKILQILLLILHLHTMKISKYIYYKLKKLSFCHKFQYATVAFNFNFRIQIANNISLRKYRLLQLTILNVLRIKPLLDYFLIIQFRNNSDECWQIPWICLIKTFPIVQIKFQNYKTCICLSNLEKNFKIHLNTLLDVDIQQVFVRNTGN